MNVRLEMLTRFSFRTNEAVSTRREIKGFSGNNFNEKRETQEGGRLFFSFAGILFVSEIKHKPSLKRH
jgi:hypothetical protein